MWSLRRRHDLPSPRCRSKAVSRTSSLQWHRSPGRALRSYRARAVVAQSLEREPSQRCSSAITRIFHSASLQSISSAHLRRSAASLRAPNAWPPLEDYAERFRVDCSFWAAGSPTSDSTFQLFNARHYLGYSSVTMARMPRPSGPLSGVSTQYLKPPPTLTIWLPHLVSLVPVRFSGTDHCSVSQL